MRKEKKERVSYSHNNIMIKVREERKKWREISKHIEAKIPFSFLSLKRGEKGFWLLDFGFWQEERIGKTRDVKKPQSVMS